MERYQSIFNYSNTNKPLIQEAVIWKYVIRKGRRKRLAVTTRKEQGYRIKYVKGKPTEVRMVPSQRRRMSLVAKRSARKRKSKTSMTNRRRALSISKRTW